MADIRPPRTLLVTNLIGLLPAIVINLFLSVTTFAEQTACRTQGTISPIPDEIWGLMQGVSWHTGMGCPARNQLRYLRVSYLDFNMRPQVGEIIVAQTVARDVLSAFNQIYCDQSFLIDKMRLIYHYGGSDLRSMKDNNTSSFNCRLTSSGKRLSEHSFGKAIDINPVQNPYVYKKTTSPIAGHPYDTAAKRVHPQRGMVRDGDIVTKAFANIAWKWGGNWRNSKDYQHFSISGR